MKATVKSELMNREDIVEVSLPSETIKEIGNLLHNEKITVIASNLSFGYEGDEGAISLISETKADLSRYDLIIVTLLGSSFIFLNTPVIETDTGAKSATSMIVDNNGNTQMVRARLTNLHVDSEYELTMNMVISGLGEFNFTTPPKATILGVRL